VAFVPVKPNQQRFEVFGGWVDGDAAFSGPNPHGGATIAYYQKSRHLFGKLKLEVLDSKGELVDTLGASVRRGLNLVSWSMHAKPPRVPPAAQVAFNSQQGPRVPPGTYTVRLTKGKDMFETKLEVGLDRRATYSVADHQAQYDAALRVRDLFNNMSDLVFKLNAVRAQASAAAAKLGEGDAMRKQLTALNDKADAIRKEIVATKEGGAITGEERLREHTDELYGAITSYDGKPTDYQLARIDALTREYNDINGEFAELEKNDLAKANDALKAGNLQLINIPAGAAADTKSGSGGKHNEDEERRWGVEQD
jgi:hypothetical protein